MKRLIWIPAMAPLMWGLWLLVLSADHLFAWRYSEGFAPPTASDYTRAAVTFFGALLTPLAIGLVMAVVAFRRKYHAFRPIPEMCIVIIPLLVLVLGIFRPFFDSGWSGRLLTTVLFGAQFLIGGVIVTAMFNLGASARHRQWKKLVLSMLVFCCGMLYLFWLYAFIIYVDT